MKDLNKIIVKKLIDKNKTISFMESCTGGFLANLITNVSGASNVLKVSLVTYCNDYKIKFGVPKNIIDEYTVYSNNTAKEMAYNASKFAKSDYGIGITGELANSKREDNKVYYSIYCVESNSFINNIILVEPNNREIMKKEVANIVLEELWSLLTKN